MALTYVGAEIYVCPKSIITQFALVLNALVHVFISSSVLLHLMFIVILRGSLKVLSIE